MTTMFPHQHPLISEHSLRFTLTG